MWLKHNIQSPVNTFKMLEEGENGYESNRGEETLMQVNRKPCGDVSKCNSSNSSILKLETYGQTDSMTDSNF